MSLPNFSKAVVSVSVILSLFCQSLQMKSTNMRKDVPSATPFFGERNQRITIWKKAESLALELKKVANHYKDLSLRLSAFASELKFNAEETTTSENADNDEIMKFEKCESHFQNGRAFYNRLRGITLSYVINLLIQIIGIGSAIHWIIYFAQEFKEGQLPKLRKLYSALHKEVSFDASFDYMIDFSEVYKNNI